MSYIVILMSFTAISPSIGYAPLKTIVNKIQNPRWPPDSFLAIQYTGCIKKKVIEFQRTIIRESLGV
jgi:hypothetical protein